MSEVDNLRPGRAVERRPARGAGRTGELTTRRLAPELAPMPELRRLRRTVSWLSCLVVGAIVTMGVAGAGGAVLLQQRAAHSEDVRTVVKDLQGTISQSLALESQVLAKEEVNPGKRKAIEAAQAEALLLQARWKDLDPDSADLVLVGTANDAYLTATAREFAFITDHQMDQARAVNDEQSEPALERLTEALDAADERYTAAGGDDRATAVTAVVLLALAAAGCVLVWLMHRAHTRTLQHIREAARHDGLTGLPNRELLRERFAQTVGDSDGSFGDAALLLIDLDGFKAVNDTFGHHCGDQLLIKAAQRMQAAIRPEDTVARLGGDEFAVLLSGMPADNVAALASSLRATLSTPFALDDASVTVSASIGAALFPTHGGDLDELLRHADTAMYTAKKNRSGFLIFGVAVSVSWDTDDAPSATGGSGSERDFIPSPRAPRALTAHSPDR